MKKIYIVMAVTYCFLLTAYAQDYGKDEGVVATINGVPLYEAELQRAVEIYIPQNYMHGNISDEKMQKAKEKAFETILEEELLYQEAKRAGVKIEEAELAAYKKRVIEFFQSDENFQKVLLKARINEKAFFNIYIKDKTVKKFNEAYQSVTYTDEELKQYYDENLEKFVEPGKIKMKMIFVQIDPSDINGTAKARARVDEAYAKLKNGEKFSDIAYKYSNDRSRVMGGDLGYIHKGMLQPEIEEIVEKLKIGELSEVVRDVKGFAIIMVEERTSPKQFLFDEIKEKLKSDRIRQEQKKRKKEMLERLKKQAKIVYISKQE